MQTRQELKQENAKIRAQLLAKSATLEERERQYQSSLASTKIIIESKDRFIDQLKEALILARNRQFAKSTESLRSLQSEFFDEAEVVLEEERSESEACAELDEGTDEDTIVISAHPRKRRGRKPLPEDLPRIEVIHDLADEEKRCIKGHDLVFMSDKVSEQLDIIPMQMRILQHIRKQYHCPCCKEESGKAVIKTAANCWPKRRISEEHGEFKSGRTANLSKKKRRILQY